MDPRPVTLKSSIVRLEPLKMNHLPALCAVGLDSAIWQWYTHPFLTEADLRGYIQRALNAQAIGDSIPFVTIHSPSNIVIGSSRYMSIDRPNCRLEIGSTWITPRFQRTAVNTHAKRLMLGHAFDDLGANRVEFKTDSLNARSRAALLRIGAREEGTFRNHMVCHDGRLRHSVYYSITKEEWPGVRARLDSMIQAGK